MTTEITSILGETRPILKTWPDGSHECPFCGYPARPFLGYPAHPRCENPACPASVYASPANRHRFEEAEAAAELLREAEARRRRDHEAAMRRIYRERADLDERRAAWYARVSAAGACHRCSDMYRDRIVRHRARCPRERRP